MIIMQAQVGAQTYFYCGLAAEAVWSTDSDKAIEFPDEKVAREDMTGMSMAYSHFVSRAQPIPAIDDVL